ncbi:MAG: hypothetical protein ACI8TA_002611, partial [Cyclobacteriaceae bacterium]
MKTTAELEQDILNITMHIEKEFPELSKYIAEMSFKSSERNKSVINIENLEEYYNSLEELVG